MAISSVQVTINGETYTLEYNSSTGKYEKTLTAPSASSGSNNSGSGPGIGSAASGKGYYPVSLVVTDDAGNSTSADSTDQTWGTQLRLKVLEKTKPVAAISYPSSGARITSSKPTFVFTITDAGSGVNPAACYIKIDNASAIAVTPVINGTVGTCSYTPSTALAEGSHTIEVYGSDYDGNTATHVSASFYIDTIAPTLNVSAPANNLRTNSSTIAVTGTTNDSTSSPVTIAITCNGQTYAPTVQANGSFSQSVALQEGSNTITIVATDAAGLSTTITRTVYLDTAAPTIVSISIQPNPADVAGSYTIAVEVTDT